MKKSIFFSFKSPKKGFFNITDQILKELAPLPTQGLLHLFIQHTSAGLTITENSDPKVLKDLDNYLEKITDRHLPHFQHNYEGLDDMPAHLKSCIIGQSLTIPIHNGKLALGTWQGVFLAEFRDQGPLRNIVGSIIA